MYTSDRLQTYWIELHDSTGRHDKNTAFEAAMLAVGEGYAGLKNCQFMNMPCPNESVYKVQERLI